MEINIKNKAMEFFMKYISIFAISVLIIVFSGCNANPFIGSGNKPDTLPPTVEITSPSNETIVSGIVTIKGSADDDLNIEKVVLYKVTASNNGTKDVEIKKTIVESGNWELKFDSTSHFDGNTIFKVIAFDGVGNRAIQNITLNIDNYGPVIIINEPIEDTTDVFFNTFNTSLTAVDVTGMTLLQWKIQSEINENAFIEGEVKAEFPNTLDSNLGFNINPSSLKGKEGFTSGYCKLMFRGVNEKGKYSLKWYTRRLFFDFSEAIPDVFIDYPSEEDEDDARKVDSNLSVTGQASDDVGISSIILWHEDPDASVNEYTLDYSDEPQKVQHFSKPFSNLIDGLHKVKVKAIDTDGNDSGFQNTHYFIVDSSFPTISYSNPDSGNWYKGEISIEATISDDSDNIINVEYREGESGTWIDDTACPGNTSTYSFSKNFDTEIKNPSGGDIRFSIRAWDANDNMTESSIVFNTDNVLPSGGISYPEEGNSGLNQDIEISGTAADEIGGINPGIVEEVRLKIGSLDEVVAQGTSHWTYQFDTTTVADGTHNLTVTIEDRAGNIRTYSRNLNVDQDADIPQTFISNLSTDDKIYGMFTLSGTATDDDAVKKVEVQITNRGDSPVIGNWLTASGTDAWSRNINTADYGTGLKTLHYRVFDIYDLSSSVFTIDFEIDPDLPIITFDNLSNDDALSIDPVITGVIEKFTGEVKSAQIRIQGKNHTLDWTSTGLTIDSTDPKNWTFSYTINSATFGNGPISVSIRASDDMDKVNSITRDAVIDTVAPGVIINLPAEGSIFTDTSLIITGSCNDPVPSSGLEAKDIQIVFENQLGGSVVVVDGSSKTISGAVTNWSYDWDIAAEGNLLKDGVYNIEVTATDRSGNATSTTRNNIRITRYRPSFEGLMISGVPIAQNMYLIKDVTFTGTIKDNNVNDTEQGVQKLDIYLNGKDEIDGDEVLLESVPWDTPEETKTFNIPYSFTQTSNYLIYRATDKTGGYTDFPLKVNIDFDPPDALFEYSSIGFGSYNTTKPTYSASYWIMLDATDDNNLDGATIQTKIGTTDGGEDIVGFNTYTVGDVMKADFKEITATPLYFWYKLSDKAGNITEDTITIARDTNPPSMSHAGLESGWLNNAGRSLSGGTANGGGVGVSNIKFSQLNPTGAIDDMTWSDATGTTSWNYTVPAPIIEGEHTIYGMVTATDKTNMYIPYTFIYDTTEPDTNISITEDDGANLGRVNGNNVSGIVTISGTYTDNYQERFAVDDIDISLDIHTVTGITVPVANRTKNPDGSISWFYEWNTQTHSSYDVVKNDVSVSVTINDLAGNERTVIHAAINVVPYIRKIERQIGVIDPIVGFDGTEYVNREYDRSYSYRLQSSSVTLTGFNLKRTGSNSIVYFNKDDSTTKTNQWTVNPATVNSLTFNLNTYAALSNGYIRVEVPGTNTISSNSKKLVVIDNYGAGGFKDIENMDMVEHNGRGMVVYQKHSGDDTSFQGRGSALFRMWESAENTFVPTTHENQESQTTDGNGEFIYRDHNRWWFINIVKDKSYYLNPAAAQLDGGYYLFSSNSENGQSAAIGLQLTGTNNFWSSYPNHFYDHYGWQVQLPVNDSGTTGDDGKNAWRPGALNGVDDAHSDWSAPWGDVVANNNLVYTVWYDNLTATMKYRRLSNGTGTGPGISTLSPTNPLDFSIKGMFPSITVDDNGYPVIVYFDEDTGYLMLKYATSNNPTTTGNWNTHTVDNSGTVGLYPSILIDGSGNIHIFYQDLSNSSLKYVYSTTAANLSSATKITLDVDSAPGYYIDAQFDDSGNPQATYIAYGYLGTGNAVRTVRYVGSTGFVNTQNWEYMTLLSERGITENKVRGYVDTNEGDNRLFGFAKSDRPEFFREKK